MRSKLFKGVVAVAFIASLLPAPAIAAGKATNLDDVKNRAKCDRRGETVVGKDGFEYKCSIIGGGLKWVKGAKAATGGSTAGAADNSKYANVSGTIVIDGSSTVAPLTTVAAEAFQKVSKTKPPVAETKSSAPPNDGPALPALDALAQTMRAFSALFPVSVS